eukprot:501905-Rhodomonas_salina.1
MQSSGSRPEPSLAASPETAMRSRPSPPATALLNTNVTLPPIVLSVSLCVSVCVCVCVEIILCSHSVPASRTSWLMPRRKKDWNEGHQAAGKSRRRREDGATRAEQVGVGNGGGVPLQERAAEARAGDSVDNRNVRLRA